MKALPPELLLSLIIAVFHQEQPLLYMYAILLLARPLKHGLAQVQNSAGMEVIILAGEPQHIVKHRVLDIQILMKEYCIDT